MKKILIPLFSLFLLTACTIEDSNSNKAASQEEIKVAAASDFTKAFREIEPQFEQQTGIKVKFIFESSGQLKEQITNGAPYDVFAAANVEYVNDLKQKNMIVPGSDQIFQLGRIGIATKKDHSLRIQTLDDLTRPEVKKIAIANPNYAPYGYAAKQALQKTGIWNQVKDKLVYAKNISDTITYLKSGNAEAGIVSLSLVQGENIQFHLIDESLHDPIQQTVAIVKSTKNKQDAQQFIDFLNDPAGKKILQKYGYTLPGGK